VEQCAPWLSHITLLVRVDGQRRMVEISLSGATGGGRVYGPWHGLRHRHIPKGVGKQLLPMTSGTAPALDPGEAEAEWLSALDHKFGHVFGLLGRCSESLAFSQTAQKSSEVGTGELPLEGLGDGFIGVLEVEKSVGDLVEVGEVVGREHFPLHDREVDLDLIEPRRMEGEMNETQVGPLAFETLYGNLTAVRASAVDDPENPMGRSVGLGRHDLSDEAAKRLDAGGGFAAAEDFRSVNIPGGQIGESSASGVLVFDSHVARLRRRQGRMAAAAGLNRGLLVCRDHVLIGAKAFVGPGAGIQIEHAAGLAGEVGIAGKDPASMGPGSNGIGCEPAPDGGARDVGHETAAEDLLSEIGDVQPGERDAEGAG